MGAPYKLYGGPYATVPYDSVQYVVRITVCKNVVCTEKHREIVALPDFFHDNTGTIKMYSIYHTYWLVSRKNIN